MSTESRAEKYNTEELNELGEKGHAFKNEDGSYSYPIGDEEDLKNAIRAVGRGNADHDSIRKYIMGRAKDLGADVLIPSNWSSDGSLAVDEAKAAKWNAEHRDGMSYGDMEDMLQSALSQQFCDDDEYCWICDFTDSSVVYSINSETFQIDYSIDGDTVTLSGDPVEVTSKTQWVPMSVTVQTNSARPVAPRVKKPRHRSGIPSGVEVRHFAADGLELRDDGSNNLQLVGMPIVYNTAYSVRDWAGSFNETMRPGVVSDLLTNGCDTRFLFNHSGLPLARTTSGTLTLEDSALGLRCVANLDARQQLATDLAVAVERGDVTQMSVGMIVGDDEWPDNENRFINKLKALEDVSAVTYPASPTTNIDIAQRMLFEMPVESRERVRRMWAITRDLRNGAPVAPEDIDVLSDGLRALAAADEELRAEPTPQDKGITKKIQAAHQAISDAIHAQMGDADNATDPVDAEVMGHLHDAAKSILKATGAQAVDGTSDVAPQPGEGGPTGTQSMPQPDGQGVMDATGSRSDDVVEEPATPRITNLELRREAEKLRLRRLERERELRKRKGA